MKKILSIISFPFILMFLMAIPLTVSAQHDSTMCVITAKVEGKVVDLTKRTFCPESGPSVNLSVPKMNNRIYSWMENHVQYSNADNITVHPQETSSYTVTVIDTLIHDTCSASVRVEVYEKFTTQFKQLMLTCSNSESENGNDAQLMVIASGGEGGPFTYHWTGLPHYQQMDTIAIGLQAYREYEVEITDAACGCSQVFRKKTAGYPTPDIVISCEPGDSVYLQNPDVTFSFENRSEGTINVVNHFWTFEHEITSAEDKPVFTYVQPQTYTASLTVYDDCGCDTTFTHELYVMPVELNIPTVFTPNGDQYNQCFVITVKDQKNKDNPKQLSDFYKSSELVVFNRWGRVVYKSSDYQNDWDGGGLSDGTYFYVLKCRGLKEEVQYQGSVMILSKTNQ